MKFIKRNMRTLNELYSKTEDYKQLTLVVPIDEVNINDLLKLGFTDQPEIGQAVLPASINRRTKENAEGKCHVRKDLPKEKYTIEWDIEWEDWTGATHSRTVWFEKERYVREYDEAYSCELEVISIGGKLFITTNKIIKTEPNEAINLHICNLMLACFGFFYVYDGDENNIVQIQRIALNWDILPRGEYPWDKNSTIKTKITNKLSKQKKAQFERRTKVIEQLSPDFVAFGRGGFNHYFIFGFKDKNIYVLESINDNNATYVFDNNWEELSQLTKAEIIRGELAKHRLIHNKYWEHQVRNTLLPK